MVEKAQEAKAQERQPKDTESTGKGWAGPVHSGASRGDNRDNRHQLDVLGDYRHASSWWVTVACIRLVRDLLHQVDARLAASSWCATTATHLPAACSVCNQGSLPHSNPACIKLARAQPSQSRT